MTMGLSWLIVDDEELKLQLSPEVLAQVETDIAEVAGGDRSEIIYKLDSELLLPVFASGFGISKSASAKGAIAVWTYYDQISSTAPIVRTLLTLDGDLSQKVSHKVLQHPIAERIISVHSFLIGQISQQMVTVVRDYVFRQLQPYILGLSTYVATRLYLCDPIRAVINSLANRLGLTDDFKSMISNFTDCNTMAIALSLVALGVWWLVIKSPLASLFNPPSQTQPSQNKPKFSFADLLQFFTKSFRQLSLRVFKKPFKQLIGDCLELLDSKWGKALGTLVILVLVICWLLQGQKVSLPQQQQMLINNVTAFLEPYLPLAIVSIRKNALSWLGSICFGNPKVSKVFIKLFFGRFLTMR